MEPPLFDGDLGTEPSDIRELLTVLFKDHLLDGNQRVRLWNVLIEHEGHVRSRLHDFYLELVVAPGHRIAYQKQVDADQDYRILTPQRAMSRELAMAVLVLVDRYQRAAVANAPTVSVARREFADAWEQMWGEREKDRVARDKNAEAALKRLFETGLIMGRSPANGGESWKISPAVPVFYGPDVLQTITVSLLGEEQDNDREDEGRADGLDGDK
ncbi:DUF4194 domain-containing protein [Luteipulveratus mongoliensis]|uniref:DUF4194 domain-containing protein n=1 Tax=Luteipulveratus mongoliensis TaxID=571913 RepID=A0A0K1JIU6_9MICO|nr:DUF4194 domain-containing protein [Luteipulveratus mongoliensis]AKU16508.1 hypothetical protein VV02_12600 [Luteipulveratus mongoliensis]